ncbi:MAG: histidinol-phosphate transaminase [Saprospiraceae bacterium]|nr:histidinol-phosphate transaminase [Saprospiraceae bacterium]
MSARNDLERLVRPNILALAPYRSARDEFQGLASASVFLDANENSLGSPLEEDFSRYPDPYQRPLKEALARQKGLLPGQIFLGNGSDEAIDLLLRAFCEPRLDNIVILPPTYGMYAVQAAVQDVEVRRAPLCADFSPDPEAVLRATDERSKLLFLCSPNNPTGNRLPDSFLIAMLERFPGLVVVDEAYIDFSEQPSVLSFLEKYPRLVVLQTFSKAWGLAALRVGMAYSNSFVINILNKIKYPYNLNVLSVRISLQALERSSEWNDKIGVIKAERERLARALTALPQVREVFLSEANFLLVRTTDADRIYAALCAEGIVVRNRTRELHCENCLRITVGSPAENDRLIAALQNLNAA